VERTAEWRKTMAARFDHLAKVASPPPPRPRIIEAERSVAPEELPRGPKAVANAVGGGWTQEWWASVAEVLEKPKRGGRAYGARFRHAASGRAAWAVWLRGSFEAAYEETRRGPIRLSASELKEVLADG
jgi:hypothetical protein